MRIATCLAALILAPVAAQAECSYTRVNLGSGTRATVNMVVDRDTACTIFANAGTSSHAAGISEFLDTSVARKPRAGIAGIASKHEWGYKPNPGYVGRDSFAVQMRFVRNTQSQPQTMLIDIDVTVK